MTIFEKRAILQKIDVALDAVRPHLIADGGNVEVVNLTEEGKVQVKWLGNCQNCSMSFITLRAGIEETLRANMPEITGVEVV